MLIEHILDICIQKCAFLARHLTQARHGLEEKKEIVLYQQNALRISHIQASEWRVTAG